MCTHVVLSYYYWDEPHSNIENGMVVHARRTVMKNGITTHYYNNKGAGSTKFFTKVDLTSGKYKSILTQEQKLHL